MSESVISLFREISANPSKAEEALAAFDEEQRLLLQVIPLLLPRVMAPPAPMRIQ